MIFDKYNKIFNEQEHRQAKILFCGKFSDGPPALEILQSFLGTSRCSIHFLLRLLRRCPWVVVCDRRGLRGAKSVRRNCGHEPSCHHRKGSSQQSGIRHTLNNGCHFFKEKKRREKEKKKQEDEVEQTKSDKKNTWVSKRKKRKSPKMN